MTTIAIIGTGNIGGAIAHDLSESGTDVLLVNKNEEQAATLATTLHGRGTPTTTEEALSRADVIILAIWLDAIQDFIRKYGDQLGGKIIIDPSNPIAPDDNGGFKKVIPQDQSSGQIVADLLPEDTRLVKAFGTLSAESLRSAAYQDPRNALYYATDDLEAGETVSDIIIQAGFVPVYVGGIDQSIRIEVFGDLHEFGGLGHPVTADEAVSARDKGITA